MKQTLYKYMSINSEERLQRFFAFISGRAYFASPNDFNDPFELSPFIRPPEQQEISHIFGECGSSNLSVKQKKRLHHTVQLACERASPVLSTREWLDRFGILCLSSKYDNLLMWAHYGDCHRGVCVGVDSGSGCFSNAREVTYSTDRPSVPFEMSGLDDDECISNVFFTKSVEWAYENEWRVVKRKVSEEEFFFYKEHCGTDEELIDGAVKIIEENAGPGVYPFDVRAVRSIYLGARIDEESRMKIINYLEENSISPKLYELSLDGKYFILNKKKLTKKSYS